MDLVFCTSFKGARRPLARDPDGLYLKDDINEANFSIDFSAIPAYLLTCDTSHPNLLSALASIAASSWSVPSGSTPDKHCNVSKY